MPLHIVYTALQTTAIINEPDNTFGSSTVVVPNQNIPVTVSAPQGIPQPGRFGTVHGRLDTFSVINNPS